MPQPNHFANPALVSPVAPHTLGGRWLLPWACLLLVAGASGSLWDRAVAQPLVHQPAATAGSRSVALAVIDRPAGQKSMTCVVAPNLVSADVLVVRDADLDTAASGMCVPATGGSCCASAP